MAANLERFIKLFTGYDKAYGVVKINEEAVKGQKTESDFEIVREEITEPLWEQHLGGQISISVIPIEADQKCRWAAIDIDRYDMEPKDLALIFAKHNLPFVVHRSKSGGAHVHVFFKQPILAKDIRKKLTDLASCMGFADEEIFPKQSTVMYEQGDLGNLLSVPYFDADQTMRYAYNDKGQEILELGAYLDFVESKIITRKEFLELNLTNVENTYEGCPPCIIGIISSLVDQGSRNDTMFQIATYFVQRFGKDDDKWKKEVEECNRQHFNPPLAAKELANIINQHEKKDYHYRCDISPFKDFCQRGACMSRRWGVSGGDAIDIGGVTKYMSEPPLYFISVDDARVEMTTEQVHNHDLFSKRVFEDTNQVMNSYKKQDWRDKLRKITKGMLEIEAPYDTSLEGMLVETINAFVDPKKAGKSALDLIHYNKVYYDKKRNMILFKLSRLMDFLRMRNYPEKRVNKISSMLKEIGVVHLQVEANTPTGKRVSAKVYGLPPNDDLNHELPVPEVMGEAV